MTAPPPPEPGQPGAPDQPLVDPLAALPPPPVFPDALAAPVGPAAEPWRNPRPFDAQPWQPPDEPWDEPWLATTTAQPATPKTRPSQARPARARRTTQRTTAAPVTRPPARRRRGLRGITVGIIFALCVGNGLVRWAIDEFRSSPDPVVPGLPLPSQRPLQTAPPLPTTTTPTRVVEGGPQTSFGLPIGTGVRFEDRDGAWTVTVLQTTWLDGPCNDVFRGGTGAVLVVDVRVESLAGAVSVFGYNDFRFGYEETNYVASLLTGCDDPQLPVRTISAGTVLSGRIAFDVPVDAGGTLRYGQGAVATASWQLPGH